MLQEKSKKMIGFVMTSMSLILNIMFIFPYSPLSTLWGKLYFYYWGWIPAIVLPSATIAIIIIFKAGSKVFIGISLLLSILALVIGIILYFLLFVISQQGLWANAL
ncbi:MAG: hypothetical protein WCZ89_08800 [Phycisphaerae bacterium]